MFLGDPTTEIIEHFDVNNELTGRSVVTRPSPWTDEDRAWLIALLAEERQTCPGCGQPMDVCRDPSTARTWQVVHAVCQACLVLEADAEGRAESGRKQRGLYVGVRRT